MAVTRVEIAVECDDPTQEGVQVLVLVAQTLGISMEDVSVGYGSTPSGESVLLAVLAPRTDEGESSE